MKIELNELFLGRCPLYLRMKDGTIYFQLQIEVAQEDKLRAGYYYEYYKIELTKTMEEIGGFLLNLIKKFHTLSDLTLNEFTQITNMNLDDYEIEASKKRYSFMGAKDAKDLERNYEECTIVYNVLTKTYDVILSWTYKKGRRYYRDAAKSIGNKNILTFNDSLGFDDNVSAERLGEIIIEGFDRSRKMKAKVLNDCCS